MSKANKLYRCPFCNSGSTLTEDGAGLPPEYARYYVLCKNCWCRGPSARSPNIAIAKWNETLFDTNDRKLR